MDKQPERDKNHMSHLYFVVFVLFGSFFVLNLFVGVIIDNFNRLKKEYESGAVGLFLTETQKAWYDTLKKAASKKPRKVAKKPKVNECVTTVNGKHLSSLVNSIRTGTVALVNGAMFEVVTVTRLLKNDKFVSHFSENKIL